MRSLKIGELTSPEKKVLEYLKDKGFMTSKDIAEDINLSGTNCRIGLNRLCSRGITEREKAINPQGRRTWVYRYLPEGFRDFQLLLSDLKKPEEEEAEEEVEEIVTSVASRRDPFMNIHKELKNYGDWLFSLSRSAVEARR